MNKGFKRRTVLGAALAAGATLSLPRLWAASAPLRIGLLAPLTGSGGPYGQGMVDAALKAAAYVNQQGGVLGGRPIEIIVADDESNPTAGVAAARKLLDVDKVSAIIGLWSSAVAMAIKPLTLERGVPLLVSGSADEITQGDNQGLVWRFQSNGRDWGRAFGKALGSDGHRTASVLALQTPFTLSLVKPFIDTFKAGGGSVIDTVFYNPGQASYRAEVEKVFAAEPSAVFIPSYLPDLSAVAREVYRGGFDARLYANSSAADAEGAFIKNVGADVAEGIHHLQSIPPLDSDAYKTFARVTGTTAPIAIFPSNVWDEVNVLALAIEHARSAEPRVFAKSIAHVVNGPGERIHDPAAGLAALRAARPIAYAGAGSSFTFDEHGDQQNRVYGHFVIEQGSNRLQDVIRL